MSQLFNLNFDVLALHDNAKAHAEVFLFNKNEGLPGRVRIPAKGDDIEDRLARALQSIRGNQATASSAKPPSTEKSQAATGVSKLRRIVLRDLSSAVPFIDLQAV